MIHCQMFQVPASMVFLDLLLNWLQARYIVNELDEKLPSAVENVKEIKCQFQSTSWPSHYR